jgi:hypothetical protein
VATVAALSSFAGWLKRDELGPLPKVLNKTTGKEQAVGEWSGHAEGLPAPGQEVKAGEQIKVFQGQLFDSNHPAVKKWPAMFGAPELLGRSTVEQAAGEKR